MTITGEEGWGRKQNLPETDPSVLKVSTTQSKADLV